MPLLAGALAAAVRANRDAACAVCSRCPRCSCSCAPRAALLYLTTDAVPDIWTEGIGVYAIGGWPAPFGIVLVVDRLSALMLRADGARGARSLVYSLARWDRVGPHFHSLLQFLLMGLNGAFLTGDLFNLFVFFEVLLAASYGLLLHGAGPARVKAGPALHRREPDGVAAVPDRRGDDLRHGRHAEHGGPRRSASPMLARDGSRIVRGRRGDSRHRVPGEGRRSGRSTSGCPAPISGRRAGGGGLRHDDQGRRVRRVARRHAARLRGRGDVVHRRRACSTAAWRPSPTASSACWPRSNSAASSRMPWSCPRACC